MTTEATLRPRGRKDVGALDAVVAVPLIIDAFEGVRELLEGAGLLGHDESSSRRFLFRFITTRALASCVQGGGVSGACDSARIAVLWSANGRGKEHLDVAGAFSRWVRTLKTRSSRNEAVYLTTDEAGIYDIRVWFFRPRDRGPRRSLGSGVMVSIEKNGRELPIAANPAAHVSNAEYLLPEALADDEEHLRAEVSRILAIVSQACRDLPARVVRLLARDPQGLTIKDMMTWWQVLGKAAKQVAITSLSLLVLFLTFCALPTRVQKKIFFGFRYAVRKPYWTADRPDIYFGPSRIDLNMPVANLGLVPPGTTARDAVTDASVTVERVGTDPLWLRARVAPPPRFRTNRTKYYISFGEAPGKGFDLVMLGPAAIAEHRFRGAGKYGLVVAVAVDELTQEQREYVPEDLRIDESWGWVQRATVTAEIPVRP